MVSPLAPALLGASAVVGKGREIADKALNQAINISVGNIDVKHIIKYAIYISIFFAVLILVIDGTRGVMIWKDQISCGLANTGCDWFEWAGAENNCMNCVPEIMPSYTFMWEAEWYLRCLLYIDLAIMVLLWSYIFFTQIFNYLFRWDYYIKKIEDWIFGTDLSGEAERSIQTRI